jgi:hypothetical protein
MYVRLFLQIVGTWICEVKEKTHPESRWHCLVVCGAGWNKKPKKEEAHL